MLIQSCMFEDEKPDSFFVWTDVDLDKISLVPGIVSAWEMSKSKYFVKLDPRYDVSAIKRKIEELSDVASGVVHLGYELLADRDYVIVYKCVYELPDGTLTSTAWTYLDDCSVIYIEGVWTEPVLECSRLFCFMRLEDAIGFRNRNPQLVIYKAGAMGISCPPKLICSAPNPVMVSDFWKHGISSERIWVPDGTIMAESVMLIERVS